VLKSIRKKQSIKVIFGNGKVFDTALFRIYYLIDDGKDVRYALSVSKRLGIAVKRNRAKRLIKAAIINRFNFPVSMVVRLKKIDFTYYEAAKELDLFQCYLRNQKLTNSNDKNL